MWSYKIIKLKNFLKLDDQLLSNRKFIIYIFITYLFSISIRFIWVYIFNDYEEFKFNSTFMLTSHDGYVFAEGARDIISGTHQLNDRSPIDTLISQFTVLITVITGLNLDIVIFYLPAVLSSLIVIPICLIARELKLDYVGLTAALIASVTWSYYNRTMLGYFDTDMLNVVFPLFIIWILIKSFTTEQNKYILFLGLVLLLSQWWYPKSYSINFSFFILILFYTIYKKKEEYHYKLTIVCLLSLLNLNDILIYDILYKSLLIYFVYSLLKFKIFFSIKYLQYFLLFLIVIFFINGGFDPIINKLNGYVFRDIVNQTVLENTKLFFFEAQNTVKEASLISFEIVANRVSGNLFNFILGFLGYFLLLTRFPILLLSLPLFGIGMLSLYGGLRFTFYAVPVFALGMSYIIFLFANKISNILNKKFEKLLRIFLLTIMVFIVLYPNVLHVINYKVPTVMMKNEVEILNKLSLITSPEDYVVAWWDYAYPIRYYSNVKTLIDGGGHSGSLNYPVSYIFTNEQEKSVKMARLEVEYAEESFFNDTRGISNIYKIMKNYDLKSPNEISDLFEREIKLPKKSRDIYLYLTSNMIDIYPTITLFSNIDLQTGQKKYELFFYKTTKFKNYNDYIYLNENMQINKKTGNLEVNSIEVPINSFITVYYNEEQKLQKKVQILSNTSTLYVIYERERKQLLIVDKKTYNSLYFQLFLLENYNKNLFEITYSTPIVKVYKIKD